VHKALLMDIIEGLEDLQHDISRILLVKLLSLHNLIKELATF
jgi:hypothetical protein